MARSSSTSSSERRRRLEVLTALAVVFAMWIVGEWGLARLLATYGTNETQMLVDHHVATARDLSARPAVVFFGDSSLRSAVNPKIVSEALGAPVLNLGTVASGGFANDHHLLERYLDAQPAPRLIVLMHAEDLSISSSEHRVYRDHFSRPLETARLLGQGFVWPEDALDLGLASVSAAYARKAYLQPILTELVFEGPSALRARAKIRADFAAERRRLGYFPHHGRYAPPADPRPPSRPARGLSEMNEHYLRRIVARLDGTEARVLFAHGPRYEGAARAASEVGRTAQLNEAIRSAAPAVGILDAEVPGYPVELVAPQVNHLNPEGAARFSSRLGTRLAERLPR